MTLKNAAATNDTTTSAPDDQSPTPETTDVTTKPAKVKKPKVKKPKVKKPKVSAAKAGHLSGKIDELRQARRVLKTSSLEWQEAHAHAGELKKTMDKNQARLNSICADIDAIQSGNYTPPLPFKDDKPKKKNAKGKAESNGHAPSDGWRGVPGIGEAAAEKIEEATTKYWREHPPADPVTEANGEVPPTLFDDPKTVATNGTEAGKGTA